jgi:hypothetical protein
VFIHDLARVLFKTAHIQHEAQLRKKCALIFANAAPFFGGGDLKYSDADALQGIRVLFAALTNDRWDLGDPGRSVT